MAESRVDRHAIVAELERTRHTFRLLVESAGDDDFDRASAGTRWTNEQLLFHMVFGFMVVLRLLPLVRLLGRLPPAIGRAHARLLNAATTPFHEINYRGSCAAALVFDRRRMVGKCDRVIDALERRLAREPERNLRLGMAFPSRWDPFFADYMTLAEVYRYPVQHFDFHQRQLTIGDGPR